MAMPLLSNFMGLWASWDISLDCTSWQRIPLFIVVLIAALSIPSTVKCFHQIKPQNILCPLSTNSYFSGGDGELLTHYMWCYIKNKVY